MRLRTHFSQLGRPVLHVTIGAAHAGALDAPLHMRRLFNEFQNFVGSREHEILDELKPLPGEHVLRKTTIGAFASTNIDSLLRALGCEQLYLTGVSTNMCVETTAREAADRGYGVTLVEDACGTTHEDLHQVTMRNFQRLFGRVRSVTRRWRSCSLGWRDGNTTDTGSTGVNVAPPIREPSSEKMYCPACRACR
ncbi:MAG: cysteine hydrolase [Betaproteobacteria bacterium]|nr:cysteine hydrolase [Betaproteobacteria bacterium]